MRLSGRKARRVCARAARPPVSRPGSGVEPERQKIWLEDVVTFWSCLLAGWRWMKNKDLALGGRSLPTTATSLGSEEVVLLRAPGQRRIHEVG